MIEIELPWPDSRLSPNQKQKTHWGVIKPLKKSQRDYAYVMTKSQMVLKWPQKELLLDIEFYPPDKRKRDLDNMLGSIKSAIDGIADATKIDDYNYSYQIKRCQPVEGGKVIIKIKNPIDTQ